MACTAQARRERQATLALLGAAPGTGSALCLPHSALGLRLPTTVRERQSLIAGQQAALRADLGEYLRKQDYYCRERRGEEADSPWRVVAHMAGAEGLAAPLLLWEHPQRARK